MVRRPRKTMANTGRIVGPKRPPLRGDRMKKGTGPVPAPGGWIPSPTPAWGRHAFFFKTDGIAGMYPKSLKNS